VAWELGVRQAQNYRMRNRAKMARKNLRAVQISMLYTLYEVCLSSIHFNVDFPVDMGNAKSWQSQMPSLAPLLTSSLELETSKPVICQIDQA
jgi:hypothetical protein